MEQLFAEYGKAQIQLEQLQAQTAQVTQVKQNILNALNDMQKQLDAVQATPAVVPATVEVEPTTTGV